MTDKPVEPMTEEELCYHRKAHRVSNTTPICSFCFQNWPCTMWKVVGTIDSLKAKVEEQAEVIARHQDVKSDMFRDLRAENERLKQQVSLPCPRIHPMDEVDKKLERLQAQLTAEQEAHEKTKGKYLRIRKAVRNCEITIRERRLMGKSKRYAELSHTCAVLTAEVSKLVGSPGDYIWARKDELKNLEKKLRASEEARERVERMHAEAFRIAHHNQTENEKLRSDLAAEDEKLAWFDKRCTWYNKQIAAKDAEIEKLNATYQLLAIANRQFLENLKEQARALEAADEIVRADERNSDPDVSKAIDYYRSLRSPAPKEGATVSALHEEKYSKEETPKDKCQFCLGVKGGVPGNENVVNGIICCDYCSSLLFRQRETEQARLQKQETCNERVACDPLLCQEPCCNGQHKKRCSKPGNPCADHQEKPRSSNHHQPTCPYSSKEAAKGNPFADCTCLEDYELGEKPKTHEFRCVSYWAWRTGLNESEGCKAADHNCITCGLKFSDRIHQS